MSDTANRATRSLHDVVIERARTYGYLSLAALVRTRKRFGLTKHGTVPRLWNGRDPMCDAGEELADALVLLAQAVEEGRPRSVQYFEAVLAVAGRLAKEDLPPPPLEELVMPTHPNRDTPKP